MCNFNDGATGTQGLGTTIVGLHPAAGATPYSIANSPLLQGCNALTMLPDDTISAAAYSANQNPMVSSDGTVNTPFSSDTFGNPWGEAYAPASEHPGPAALYISTADGTIDRITLSGDAQNTFTQIASGFCASGTPGAIYAPAGLTYDASIDTLYIVDTSSYSVVAFANVSSIGADGIVVDGQCGATAAPPTPPTFTVTTASAASARVIAHGDPLIAPLSAALLADGNLIVANSDINIGAGQRPNLVVEVLPFCPAVLSGSRFNSIPAVRQARCLASRPRSTEREPAGLLQRRQHQLGDAADEMMGAFAFLYRNIQTIPAVSARSRSA